MKKLIKNIFVPLLEIQHKIVEFNENVSKEEKIVKIISKIEHSIFDKNYTYFSCPETDETVRSNENLNNEQADFANKNGNEQKIVEENDKNKKDDAEKLKETVDQDSLEECLVNLILFYFLLFFNLFIIF